ncbi:acyl-CoA reductase [Burkholderia sp. F1]|uniref:acyl-CoA reductase n=1 Tax=Burkholderia sp. F1 TaxID=3366817 RepID=UPI003D729314
MIRIPAEILAKMTVLAGNPAQVSNAPAPVFDPLRVDFLADMSRALLAHPVARTMPDVVSFAYWSRRANLTRLGVAQLENDDRASGVLRLGLGLSFHICPSNVPVNFAFSLAFGLLSGNTCVLRLPSKPSATAEHIVDAVAMLLAQDKYAPLSDAIVLARFDRDDDVNRFWLGVADARVVWGGDATVAHLRSLPCRPRSREVAFSDRYSLCAIAPEAVLELDQAGLRALCSQLYNDLYLMDQAACSSPQLLAWIGDKRAVKAAQARLWPELAAHARMRYVPQAVQVMDKYVDACRHAVGNEQVVAIERHGNVLYRIEIADVTPDQDSRRGYFGTIHEVALASLAQLAPIVNERYQTLTYFGIELAKLRAFVLDGRLRGVDRVVPVGRALDMDVIWDGYDIVAGLSRVVDLR